MRQYVAKVERIKNTLSVQIKEIALYAFELKFNNLPVKEGQTWKIEYMI
jgi:hypothetical protein